MRNVMNYNFENWIKVYQNVIVGVQYHKGCEFLAYFHQ